ncbi:hypothetical protein GGE60_002215 [Rhizobium leucaenae]|uniref:Uncharacterized protein n=1 Tax=Rhizobium leucaenae TaxID=29450 RepID=A0A7W6ZSV8_9HYPH|nr:hypothetical protein [Rhizobium leucaenae]
MQLAEYIGRRDLAQIRQIVLIHCQDQVEPMKIGCLDAACVLSGNIDAVA